MTRLSEYLLILVENEAKDGFKSGKVYTDIEGIAMSFETI